MAVLGPKPDQVARSASSLNIKNKLQAIQYILKVLLTSGTKDSPYQEDLLEQEGVLRISGNGKVISQLILGFVNDIKPIEYAVTPDRHSKKELDEHQNADLDPKMALAKFTRENIGVHDWIGVLKVLYKSLRMPIQYENAPEVAKLIKIDLKKDSPEDFAKRLLKFIFNQFHKLDTVQQSKEARLNELDIQLMGTVQALLGLFVLGERIEKRSRPFSTNLLNNSETKKPSGNKMNVNNVSQLISQMVGEILGISAKISNPLDHIAMATYLHDAMLYVFQNYEFSSNILPFYQRSVNPELDVSQFATNIDLTAKDTVVVKTQNPKDRALMEQQKLMERIHHNVEEFGNCAVSSRPNSLSKGKELEENVRLLMVFYANWSKKIAEIEVQEQALRLAEVMQIDPNYELLKSDKKPFFEAKGIRGSIEKADNYFDDKENLTSKGLGYFCAHPSGVHQQYQDRMKKLQTSRYDQIQRSQSFHAKRKSDQREQDTRTSSFVHILSSNNSQQPKQVTQPQPQLKPATGLQFLTPVNLQSNQTSTNGKKEEKKRKNSLFKKN